MEKSQLERIISAGDESVPEDESEMLFVASEAGNQLHSALES